MIVLVYDIIHTFGFQLRCQRQEIVRKVCKFCLLDVISQHRKHPTSCEIDVVTKIRKQPTILHRAT